MKHKNRKLAESVRQLLEDKGREALDVAKRRVFKETTYCREVKDALKHFFGYWDDLARPSLISISCEAVGGDPKITIPFAASMTLICGAADVHDDIIDKSKRKLSHSTIFGKFGQDIALLVGDALFFKGSLILQKASARIHPKKVARVQETIENFIFEMGNAEALELKLRRNINVKIKDYLHLVKMKAADIEACARIGAILGNGSDVQIDALGRYGRMLGVIIILRDDLADMVDYEEAPIRFKNEALPLPILIALKNTKAKSQIAPILLKQKIRKKDIEIISEIVHNAGAIENAKKIIKEMYTTARSYLQIIPNNKYLKMLAEAALLF